MYADGEAHWYTNDGGKKYLPSVSTVLGLLKDGLEYVSPYDLRIAAERGVKVHAATEKLEQDNTLLKDFYSDKEWEMIAGFIQWHADISPQATIASEKLMLNKRAGFAGTLDRIYSDGRQHNTLLDIKTTAAIYPKHWLQVAAYAKLAELEGTHIEEVAILRLTDRTKKRYQYETRNREEWLADYKKFENILKVWRDLNGDKQPKMLELPDTLSLNVTTT